MPNLIFYACIMSFAMPFLSEIGWAHPDIPSSEKADTLACRSVIKPNPFRNVRKLGQVQKKHDYLSRAAQSLISVIEMDHEPKNIYSLGTPSEELIALLSLVHDHNALRMALISTFRHDSVEMVLSRPEERGWSLKPFVDLESLEATNSRLAVDLKSTGLSAFERYLLDTGYNQ